MLQALDFYEVISVYKKDGKIFTDGSKRTRFTPPGTHSPSLQFEHQWTRLRYAFAHKTTFLSPKPNKQIHYRIAPSVHDKHLKALRTELTELHPTLQRNLGIITTISILELLAQSIELHEVITVSDASVGSRQRASHSYTLTSKYGAAKMEGSTPIDCDHEDIESTRAEMYGAVALHTIILILMNMFSILSGEVELYGDNSDSLCKNPINTSAISFPRFFRPNADLKLQI